MGRIGSDLGRNVFTDALGHPVAIGKQGTKVVVEGFENLAHRIKREVLNGWELTA